jgi:hypothetical protein
MAGSMTDSLILLYLCDAIESMFTELRGPVGRIDLYLLLDRRVILLSVISTFYHSMQVPRHDRVKETLPSAYRSIPGVTAILEPRILQARGTSNTHDKVFNDIRVSGSAESGIAPTDYDVVISSFGLTNAVSWGTHRTLDPDPIQDAQSRIHKWAQHNIRRKMVAIPTNAPGGYSPLVFSSGGYAEPATLRALDTLKQKCSPGQYSFAMTRIAFILVRHLAKCHIA